MTREEAIKVLQTALTSPLIYGEYADAINMAIEALSDHSGEVAEMVKKDLTRLKVNVQDANNVHNLHSGDLISRADAIEAIQNAYCKPCKERGDDYNEVRCRACEYDNAIIQIDALPSADTEWIPCSERLPEEDGWYLVTVQGYETVTDVSLYSADGCEWGDVSTKQKVIAWMPLPKPYREESEVEE